MVLNFPNQKHGVYISASCVSNIKIMYYVYSGFIQASKSSLASPTVFKGLKLMKNTDLSVQILLQKC